MHVCRKCTEFIDVATSRTVYDLILVSWDDTDRAEIAKRVATLTRKFDLSKFRSLTMLSSNSTSPQETELRVEIDHDALRLIDRKTHVAVLRYRWRGRRAIQRREPRACYCSRLTSIA